MHEFNLIDTLPTTVNVGRRVFPIHSDFRIGIQFEQLMQREMANEALLRETLRLYYGDCAPLWSRDMKDAIAQAVWFYSCGKSPQKIQKTSKQDQARADRRVYDYFIDAPYIYAAFQQAYQIDLLESDNLHWWKFSALFRALPDACRIVQIMRLRAKDLSEIKDSEERSRIAAEQAKWALPTNLTTEQKISLAGSLFGKGLPTTTGGQK